MQMLRSTGPRWLPSAVDFAAELNKKGTQRVPFLFGGARQDRTADLLRARQALSQLSYGPRNLTGSGSRTSNCMDKLYMQPSCSLIPTFRPASLLEGRWWVWVDLPATALHRPHPYHPNNTNNVLVGLGGFEPPTSPLSGVRSNQLSYRPGSTIQPNASHPAEGAYYTHSYGIYNRPE